MFWMILQAVEELSNRPTLVTDPIHAIKNRKSVGREKDVLKCMFGHGSVMKVQVLPVQYTFVLKYGVNFSGRGWTL